MQSFTQMVKSGATTPRNNPIEEARGKKALFLCEKATLDERKLY